MAGAVGWWIKGSAQTMEIANAVSWSLKFPIILLLNAVMRSRTRHAQKKTVDGVL